MKTILQISDPHLLSSPDGRLKDVRTADVVQRVLDRARQDFETPACVVLSGDLSHEHTVAGYELLKQYLGAWSDMSLLIPGNHDDRSGLRAVFSQVPGEGDEEIWFRHEIGGWQLLGLDSQVTGEVYGELSESMLAQAESWLSEDPQRPKLVFLHHPPVAVNSPWIDELGLRNAEAFARIVANSPNVQGVFSGHIHQEFSGPFAGTQFYSCPSASIQFTPRTDTLQLDSRPPGFRVIELNDHRFHTQVRRVGC